MRKAYVVMGVSGCGKSTVAKKLAGELKGLFIDGDDYHPAANKQKMSAGVPLTDEDRWGWLAVLNSELKRLSAERAVFLACSALKQSYRDQLGAGVDLTFIYLKGSQECIRSRMEARHGHFMPAKLLASQFATLEEPHDALTISIEQPLEQVIADAVQQVAKAG